MRRSPLRYVPVQITEGRTRPGRRVRPLRLSAQVSGRKVPTRSGGPRQGIGPRLLRPGRLLITERHCEIAAELLAAHGDLTAAAYWYDRAAARLTDDQLDTRSWPAPTRF